MAEEYDPNEFAVRVSGNGFHSQNDEEREGF